MVTEALAAPFYAPLADKFGRRPVFIPLVFLWGIFSFAFGFVGTPWGVVFLRACRESLLRSNTDVSRPPRWCRRPFKDNAGRAV